jgi:hypothetical protein
MRPSRIGDRADVEFYFTLLHVLLGVEVWNGCDADVAYPLNSEVAGGATKSGPTLSIVQGVAQSGQSRMGSFDASCRNHAFTVPDPQATWKNQYQY